MKPKSVSPDIKKDFLDKNDKNKKVKFTENNIKKEKFEKTEKIIEKENLKCKKTSINMNIKKIIKNKEKELHQNYLKTEENTTLGKKLKEKVQEKQLLETKNSLNNITKVNKDSSTKLKIDKNTQILEGLSNINLDIKEIFEIVYLVNEISSLSTNQSSQVSTELSKSLRGFNDLNKSKSLNSLNVKIIIILVCRKKAISQ